MNRPIMLRRLVSESSARDEKARCHLKEHLEKELLDAERKALKSLAGYKFQMFGYWAAIWVHLNRVGGFKRPNPFRKYVQLAQGQLENR